MVALAVFRMSPVYSTPTRINTKGFRKSDGFMVIQNAGIPYRTIIPRISERIVSFWAEDPGTRIPGRLDSQPRQKD
jgi:hypothetical protein